MKDCVEVAACIVVQRKTDRENNETPTQTKSA